jgi:hypothetical protein
MEKIDIVLQGKFEDRVNQTAKDYLEYPFVNKVVISCWEGDNVSFENNERIEYVISKPPEKIGTGRRNYQIVSSLNGLKKCESKIAAKFRSDQQYHSIDKMYDFFLSNSQREATYFNNSAKPLGKILVGGNFVCYPFHPRDHFFWGYTEDLIDLFSIPLEQISLYDKIVVDQDKREEWQFYKYFVRTETYIGSHYASRFIEFIKFYILESEHYLQDGGSKIEEAMQISNQVTPKIFKSFPRECIEKMTWFKYNWNEYKTDSQYNNFGERWHEDGV